MNNLMRLSVIALALVAPTPAFANSYWHGFKKFWGSFLSDYNGVAMTAIVVGLISLFIITRGKWGKS